MRSKYLSIFLVCLLVVSLTGCGKREDTTKQATSQKESQVQAIPRPSSAPITEERTLFSFEKGYDGFEIPSWFKGKADNAGVRTSLSKSFASEGTQSLCLTTKFPGRIWSSAILELEQYLDLTRYRQIAVDIYIPANVPLGLKAKIVLTVGENWKWIEMVRSIPLSPGEWITVSASVENGSMDWKRTEVNELFRADIRKVVVRIESNKTPIYSGPIYIDNVRVGR